MARRHIPLTTFFTNICGQNLQVQAWSCSKFSRHMKVLEAPPTDDHTHAQTCQVSRRLKAHPSGAPRHNGHPPLLLWQDCGGGGQTRTSDCAGTRLEKAPDPERTTGPLFQDLSGNPNPPPLLERALPPPPQGGASHAEAYWMKGPSDTRPTRPELKSGVKGTFHDFESHFKDFTHKISMNRPPIRAARSTSRPPRGPPAQPARFQPRTSLDCSG